MIHGKKSVVALPAYNAARAPAMFWSGSSCSTIRPLPGDTCVRLGHVHPPAGLARVQHHDFPKSRHDWLGPPVNPMDRIVQRGVEDEQTHLSVLDEAH